MEAHADDFVTEPGRFAWIYLRMVDFADSAENTPDQTKSERARG
jgi:hypothetical protein